MSMAGLKIGMDDDIYLLFLDMITIVNTLERVQCMHPLYCFENTWLGPEGHYPNVVKASDVRRVGFSAKNGGRQSTRKEASLHAFLGTKKTTFLAIRIWVTIVNLNYY